MPAPTSTPELLELLYKSGLTDEARLREYVGSLTAAQPLPSDPAQFANALINAGFLTVFQVKQLLQGRWKRFTIGENFLLEFIGADTDGAFYLCEDTRIRRVVVLKALPVESMNEPLNVERFYREARALGACDHWNVARVFAVTQLEGLHFLTMEFVDGANLLDIVRRGPLDPVRVAHYVAQAANGLQHIHARGMVHRNVKPNKLMLDRGGVVKLCGMSLVLFRNDAAFVDDAIRGTPDYIAPEQAIDSSGVDPRADIYSLGCTAYHLLTGQVPFKGGSVAQKMVWHQARDPAPIRSLRPEVPEAMARVVERMMAKDPSSRYQSMAEVTAALIPWCGTVIPPPPAEELPNYCPRVREAIARSHRTPP